MATQSWQLIHPLPPPRYPLLHPPHTFPHFSTCPLSPTHVYHLLPHLYPNCPSHTTSALFLPPPLLSIFQSPRQHSKLLIPPSPHPPFPPSLPPYLPSHLLPPPPPSSDIRAQVTTPQVYSKHLECISHICNTILGPSCIRRLLWNIYRTVLLLCQYYYNASIITTAHKCHHQSSVAVWPAHMYMYMYM